MSGDWTPAWVTDPSVRRGLGAGSSTRMRAGSLGLEGLRLLGSQ